MVVSLSPLVELTPNRADLSEVGEQLAHARAARQSGLLAEAEELAEVAKSTEDSWSGRPESAVW